MTSSHRVEPPIEHLLSKLLDGVLEEGESERFAELLAHDPQARQAYHEHIGLHAMLHWIDSKPLERAEEAELPDAASPRAAAKPAFVFVAGATGRITSPAFDGWPLAYLVASLVLAVGLIVGRFVPVSEPVRMAAESPAEAPHAVNPAMVGQVTGMVDCKWATEPPRPARADEHLEAGRRLALDSGLLEITYEAGAKLVLQGPVTYEVESPAGGYLVVGKLTAKLEKGDRGRRKAEEAGSPKSPFPLPASPFVVRTPAATIVDLGTEFGVEVDQKGFTKSYVLVGTVRVEPAGNDKNPRRRAVVLHARDSVGVGKSAGSAQADLAVVHNLAEPDHLIWPAQFAKMVSQQRHEHLARRQPYTEHMQHDPALVAYYDFQRRKETPNELHAVGPGANGARNGRIQGAPPQTFEMLQGMGVNVFGGKPVVVSSSYGSDPLYAATHLTDRSETSHAFSDGDSDQRLVIHGFNSPVAVIRLWRAEDRIAQQVTIKSSLSDLSSLNGADHSTTLASLSSLSFNDAGYVDIAVKAPAGTQSLFFDFGDRTEYYPTGGWSQPAGIRTLEVQAFATPPANVVPSAPRCWARGRTPTRTALHFDGANTRVKINVPQRLTQMTLAAWITVDFIDDRFASSGLLTSSDWGEPGSSPESVHWHIGRTGEILFGTPGCSSSTPSVLPWQTWDRNRWRHLAVVTDPAHQRSACYLDGKPIHVQTLSDSFAATIGAAGIGSWQHADGRIGRGFCGRMDELVILSRAMTDAEIGELYEMERP